MTDHVEGSEIRIELGEVSYRTAERKRRPDADRSLVVLPYGNPPGDGIAVFIHERALAGIEAHAASDTSVELGGALLGGFYRDGDRQFVEITDFIVAEKVEHSAAQITFTHNTWAEIERERESRQGKPQIVGWYHTHPDLGVFLSDADIFIQQNFFREPWQVAMVVDPVRADRGFFLSWKSALRRTPGFFVFSEKKRKKALEAYVSELQAVGKNSSQTAKSADKGRNGVSPIWMLILSLLFVAVLVGEGLTKKPLLQLPTLRQRNTVSAWADNWAHQQLQRGKSAQGTEHQREFIRWFLGEADKIEGKERFRIRRDMYRAAGVPTGRDRPEKTEYWTQRDAQVAAAYAYLAEKLAKSRATSAAEEEENQQSFKFHKLPNSGLDDETLRLAEKGLAILVKEQQKESSLFKDVREELRTDNRDLFPRKGKKKK